MSADPDLVQLIERLLELKAQPDFSLESKWCWYWPRSKYVPGQLPLIDFVGVLSEEDMPDRVRVYAKQSLAGELLFPAGGGHAFAEQTLQLIRLPKERAGAFFYKELEDGRDITVYPCWPPEARVCISLLRNGGLDDAYYYPTVHQALAAAMAWDGISEPEVGWNRHLATDRWRRDGDPAQETIGEWDSSENRDAKEARTETSGD
jgi:hypothetical protein